MPLLKIIFVSHGVKKAPANAGAFCDGANHALRDLRDIGRLRAFLTLNNFEFNSIAFGKGFESRARYRAEVDEHVGASLSGDEAKTFRLIPFPSGCELSFITSREPCASLARIRNRIPATIPNIPSSMHGLCHPTASARQPAYCGPKKNPSPDPIPMMPMGIPGFFGKCAGTSALAVG